MAVQPLSTIRPDLEDIVARLQASLSTKNAWKGILPTDAGQTILEFIAAVGALDQFALENIFKEMFPQTSRVDSNALGIARLLGVRLKRKSPANVEVTFSNEEVFPITIPKFTAFDINGVKLFNRDQITIPAGASGAPSILQTFLYEGTLRSTSIISSGVDFQSFISSELSFEVSDVDVDVTVAGVPVTRSNLGLWKYKKTASVPVQNYFQDLTTRTGALQILFGNDLFALKPAVNDLIEIRYMITKGSLGNDGSLVGENITYSGQPENLIITATTGLKNGSDELPASLYKRLAPQTFASQDVAVQKQDYDIIFNNPIFPVADYRIQGQRDLDTTDVRFMNLSKVWLLLPDDALGNPVVPTPSEFEQFNQWLRRNAVWTMYYFYDPVFEPIFGLARPVPMAFYIEVEVYCKNNAELPAIKTSVENTLKELVAIGPNSISRNIYRSDIIYAIQESSSVIDYVILKSPTVDIVLNEASLEPTASVSTTGGTLGDVAEKTYTYLITANFTYTDPNNPMTTISGETTTSFFVYATTQAGETSSSIVLNWEALYGAVSYNIYGREAGSIGLLATVTGTTYTDTGANAPAATPPTQDTSGFRFPKIEPKPGTLIPNNGILVSTFFSER